MKTAKLFQHGGSQAVRLPKAFRFEGTEVIIKKQGRDVLLRSISKPQFRTFKEMGRHLAEKFPDGDDFPAPPPRPKAHERDILEF